MKYLKFILVISCLILIGVVRGAACGPYHPNDPDQILIFRTCSPELQRQWQEGCRFQDYEKEENCKLWQHITSSSIPLNDIEKVVYDASLSDLSDLSKGSLSDNKFAAWLSDSIHREDLEYILVAKEIEEIRNYMNDPWYYAYDGDFEHERLNELQNKCLTYNGKRHNARYALQLVRLYFAVGDFKSCIDLWENQVSKLPQNIVTDMIASYVGGAYSRKGDREKAVELFTLSRDIGSLISMKEWAGAEEKSAYTDDRIKELEYILNRFPDSPLLSIKLHEYVRWREMSEAVRILSRHSLPFYEELIRFAKSAAGNKRCHQRGMWNYALSYLYYLDGDTDKSLTYLNRAEQSECSPFIKESIWAFRFLMNAQNANNGSSYKNQLLKDLKWLDERLATEVNLNPEDNWQYDNKMNRAVSYWQDVARKVLLGTVCPKMNSCGNSTLALQLANYATNRIHQIAPLYQAYHYGYDDPEDPDYYNIIIPYEEYRNTWSDFNWFDYSNQFFEMINGVSAAQAAEYGTRITQPITQLDRFLNERSYVETDYIYDIIGTLYLREMDYENAQIWLSKVSTNYQKRTNVAKEGYFRLDPFRYQYERKHYIADSTDYKLRFAQEMLRLERLMNSDCEINRKANAKIKYAIGLRNSFGRCWYLTAYEYHFGYDASDRCLYSSINREGFTKNQYAQEAYKRVDRLMEEAINEFTDKEAAANAQLEMMNYATVMNKYPDSEAAALIRTGCDTYYDYAFQLR